MKVNLPKIYSQLDPLWKNKTFGAGATIGDYGCLLTCVSMASSYFGHYETPVSLADKVDFSGNLWIWGQLTAVYSDITYQGMKNTPDQLTKEQMDEIRSIIDAGYPVFLQIDVVPSTSTLDEHWVLAVDYNGDDFIIVNPYGGYTHKITDYGIKPQLLIWAYTHYRGKLPTSTQPADDALTECLTQHTKLVTECELLKKQLTEKDTVISTQSSELLKSKETLTKALEQSDIYKDRWEKSDALREKWLGLYNQVKDNYDSCVKDRTTFQKQLTECLNKGDLTWGELLIKIWEKLTNIKI